MPFYRFSQGAVQLTVIQAQPEETISALELFPNIDVFELEKVFERIPQFFAGTSQLLRFTQNICIIHIHGKSIMVDTGIPVDHTDAMLLSGMREAGIQVEEIDFVILSHRDLDHIGGTISNGTTTFPNARYIMARTEYESYRVDPVRNHFSTYIGPIESAGKLDVVDDEAIVMPGLRLLLTPGHRPGAVSVLVDESILITADVWHCASQVTHPEWQIKWDTDANLAVETRKWILNLAEQNGYLVAVPHTVFFGLGRIARELNRQVWLSTL